MKLKMLLVGSLGFLLVSCGGQKANAPAGNVNGLLGGGNIQAEIGNFLTMVQANPATALPSDVNGLPTVSKKKAIFGAYDDCVEFLIGESMDDAHYKVKYDCKNIDEGEEGTYSWIGTVESKVEDEDDFSKGFRQDYDIKSIYKGDPIISYYDYKGFNSLVRSASTIVYESNFSYDILMENYRVPLDWGFRREFKSTYTPEDMDSPFTAGSYKMEGFYEISGLVGDDSDGKNLGDVKLGFEIKSQGLVYDSTCSYFFKKGSFTFIDGAKNALKFEYDCTGYEVTLNGKEVDWGTK
jgi:hypothetical protein